MKNVRVSIIIAYPQYTNNTTVHRLASRKFLLMGFGPLSNKFDCYLFSWFTEDKYLENVIKFTYIFHPDTLSSNIGGLGAS